MRLQPLPQAPASRAWFGVDLVPRGDPAVIAWALLGLEQASSAYSERRNCRLRRCGIGFNGRGRIRGNSCHCRSSERTVTGGCRCAASALRYILRSQGRGPVCVRPLNLIVRCP
jgi:hypothetical protein